MKPMEDLARQAWRASRHGEPAQREPVEAIRLGLVAARREALEEAADYVDAKGEEIAKRTGDMPALVYSLADGIRRLGESP